MTGGRLLPGLSLIVACALLAGCGGGGDAPASSTSPTSSVSASSPISPSGSTYVTVPAGVQLTDPGTALSLGQPATVAWTPRQDVVGVVDLDVTRIDLARAATVFRGYQVDARTRASTPFFVHATVTNTGTSDLSGRILPMYVVDTRGQLVEPTGVADTFTACPGSALPSSFAPGAKATVCLVFLTPQGTRLTAVRFQPPVGVDPVTWTGAVKVLQQHRAKPTKHTRKHARKPANKRPT